MTSGQMKSPAKNYLNSGKLNILLVGDKAGIQGGLQKPGYPIVELDVDGKPIEKKGF